MGGPEVRLIPLSGLPEVREGDDVAAQIIELLNSGDQSQALTRMRTRRQHIEVIAGVPGV